MSKSNVLCIYHADCVDGFTAAWVVWQKHPDAEFVAAKYGDLPPPYSVDRDVIIVDFSYPRETMEDLVKAARSLVCLDHHQTAEQELRDLPGCILDKRRSGATLAWDEFNAGQPRPKIVQYAEDRDLWLHRLDATHEVNAVLRSHRMDLPNWHRLAKDLEEKFNLIRAEGAAILRYQERSIELHAGRARLARLTTGGAGDANQLIPIVACTDPAIVSAIGQRLCEAYKAPYAVMYADEGRVRTFQLRSLRGSGADVAEIAARFGGGGHRHAAGFNDDAYSSPWVKVDG